MLSSVLNSKRAVQVNILIMRAFAQLRELMATHKGLVQKLEKLEEKVSNAQAVIWKMLLVAEKRFRRLKDPRRRKPPELFTHLLMVPRKTV